MKLRYERDMTHNYMIPEIEHSVQGDDYRIHMLMENEISGLLPCHIRKQDGQEEFRYDITSRQSLQRLYDTGHLGEPELRIFFASLLRTLGELKKYLLDSSMLVLDPQIIYMDVETREPVFCYLPGYSKEITESFRKISKWLLDHLNQEDIASVLLGYRVYREAREENYCLERVLNQAEPLLEPLEPFTEATKEAEIKSISVEEPKKVLKNEAEAKDVKRKESKKKESKKEIPKEQKKQKFTGKMFLIICFAAAVFMTLAAAWLWKLSSTQTGGILLLMTVLMAYGFSMEPQKAEAKQEEPDYDSYGFQEQEIVQEWRKPQKQEIEKQELRKQEEKKFGNTSVLYEKEEIEPCLALVRIHAECGDRLILLQDRIIVGKLDTQADFVIRDNSVSRIHAEISKKREGYELRDLNSTNGTYVNGRRLMINEKIQIRPGDEIAFARAEYRVERYQL